MPPIARAYEAPLLTDAGTIPGLASRIGRWLAARGVPLAGHVAKLSYLDVHLSRRPATTKAVAFNVLLTIAWLAFGYVWSSRKRVLVVAYTILHVLVFAVVLCCFANNDALVPLASLWGLHGEAMEMPLGAVVALGGLPLLAIVDLPLLGVLAATSPATRRTSLRMRLAATAAVASLVGLSFSQGIKFGPKSDERSLLRLHGVVACWLNQLTLPTSVDIPLPPQRPVAAATASAKRNVVLIQVESLDASALLVDVDGHPLCPFLRAFAARNVYCPFLLSHHYAGNSSDCDFAVLTGSEPALAIPSLKYAQAPRLSDSLPAFLRQRGYATVAWHDFEATFFNRRDAYRSMGFDRFEDPASLGLDPAFGGDDADLFARRARSLTSRPNGGGRRFDYVITVTSHTPFTFARKYDGLAADPFATIDDRLLRDYLRSISYVDRCLATLLQQIGDDSIVILFGDHPPAMPIQDGTRTRASDWPGARVLVDGTLAEFVPLVIHAPGLPPRTMTTSASYEDVAATVASLVGGGALRCAGYAIAERDPMGDLPNRGTVLDRRLAFEAAISAVRLHRPGGPFAIVPPAGLERSW